MPACAARRPVTYSERLEATRDLGRGPSGRRARGCPGSGRRPGSPNRATVLMRNPTRRCSTPALPRRLQRVGAPVRYPTTPICLRSLEATDGAAAGAGVVFAVIIGTDVGPGSSWTARGRGRNLIAASGATPPARPRPDEFPGRPACAGGATAGALAQRLGFAHLTGQAGEAWLAAAAGGDGERSPCCTTSTAGRGLAVAVDILDPDVSSWAAACPTSAGLPGPAVRDRAARLLDICETPIVKAAHGDSSGVAGRGLALAARMKAFCRDCFSSGDAAVRAARIAPARASWRSGAGKLAIAHGLRRFSLGGEARPAECGTCPSLSAAENVAW